MNLIRQFGSNDGRIGRLALRLDGIGANMADAE
jgi:hypothetical protein